MKFQRTLLAGLLAGLTGLSAQAALTADQAKALGTTLTGVGAEKAGNKDGTIPAYTGGLTAAAGRLQGRRRHPPEPLCQRQAAAGDRRQEHGAACRQADRRHEGAAAAVPDVPRRRVPDAAQRRLPEVRARQHREDRADGQDRQRRPLDRRRARRLPVPDPEGRLRGDVEPPGALQRPGLRVEVPQPDGRRQWPRHAGHRRQQRAGVSVLGPEQDQRRDLLAHQAELHRAGTPRR